MQAAIDTQKLEIQSKSDSVQPPAVYGEDLQIASLVRRARKLIKGCENAPDDVIWRGCQIATMHHLDIFSGDVWIYPAGGDDASGNGWVVDIGISAWRRAAQRQAKYNCAFTVLSPEETAKRVGKDYTPEDIGVRCDLYRLDVARECKELGIPYEPVTAYGFWRKNARLTKSGAWKADQLANTETKEDKAKKRAEKKALKIAFTLDYPDERLVDLDSKTAADTQWAVVSQERLAAMPANNTPKTQVEENGDQIWA